MQSTGFRSTLAIRYLPLSAAGVGILEGGVEAVLEATVARRGTRAEQYLAVAEFYGGELLRNLRNPHVPEFVIVHAARRAAHYALTGARLQEKGRRNGPHPRLPADTWGGAGEASPV
jgi:hypothetical protein